MLIPETQSRTAVLTVVGVWWRKPLLDALGEHTVMMEVFFIALAAIAGTGIAFFLFVIEPRRKIYDYDPGDLTKV